MIRNIEQRLAYAGSSALGRDTMLLWCLQVILRLSGVIVLMVLSRKVSPEDIGLYFFALSVAESLSVFCGFGMDAVMMRRVASTPEETARHISPLLGFRIFSSPAYLVCVFIAAIFLAPQACLIMGTVAVMVLAENLYFSLFNLIIALKKVAYNVWIGLAVQFLYMLAFLYGMWRFPSLAALIGANLIRACLLLFISAFIAHRWIRVWNPAWSSSCIREGAPFLLLQVIALMQEKMDTLLLGLMTDFESVAHYSLALRVITATYFIPQVLGTVFFPHISVERNIARIRSMVFLGALLLFGTAIAAMATGYLGAVPLTSLFYGKLSGSVSGLLKPLTLLFPVHFLVYFFTPALQALRRERKALTAQAVASAASVILNLILIPVFAVQGAIFAKLISGSLQLILLAGFLWPILSVSSHVPLGKPAHGPEKDR
jgi:O-antigen/teichoic acid export membrane protein